MNLKIIMISETQEQGASIIAELTDLGRHVTSFVFRNGLLADISQCDPDVLVFYMQAPTKSALETIKIINFTQPKPIIVLVNETGLVNADEVIKSGVSSYIVDGFKPGRMKAIIDVALARFTEHQSLCKELSSVKEKLDDRKWIDKAKGILMQLKGMSEDEAYKAMRKMAMENNRRLVDIAKNIISISHLATDK